MALRSIRAFGHDFDLVVERKAELQSLSVTIAGETAFSKSGMSGEEIQIRLP